MITIIILLGLSNKNCHRTIQSTPQKVYESTLDDPRKVYERVQRIDAEYYRRTSRKPIPYWEMPN